MSPFNSEWWKKANCLSCEDLRIFFSNGKHEALGYCDDCCVRSECLSAALDEEEGMPLAFRTGIRGGATPGERHRLARLAS